MEHSGTELGYHLLLGCPPEQSHGAEADCLALLRVTAVLGEEFLNWVHDNYYKLRHCHVMWSMPASYLVKKY